VGIVAAATTVHATRRGIFPNVAVISAGGVIASPRAAASVPPDAPEFVLFVLFLDFCRRHGLSERQRQRRCGPAGTRRPRDPVTNRSNLRAGSGSYGASGLRPGASFGLSGGCIAVRPNRSAGVHDELRAATLNQIAGFGDDVL